MMSLSHLPKVIGDEWPLEPAAESSAPVLSAEQAWPRISIVTPSFNQGPYLEKTIRSVLLQGYPNLEYIIIDGGSTDQSLDVIKKYEPWLSSWVSEKDRGQSHAINKGFEHATGELLGWLNSDDWYTEGALFKLASAWMDDQTAGAVYGQGHIVDHEGKVTHTPKLVQIDRDSLLDWANGSDFMQPSCLFTNKAWRDCGPLDESLHYSLDVDLWLKIADDYYFNKIEDLLSFSLSHSGAKTTAMRNAMYADLAIVLMRHGGEVQARRILDRLVTALEKPSEYSGLFDKLSRSIKNYTKGFKRS